MIDLDALDEIHAIVESWESSPPIEDWSEHYANIAPPRRYMYQKPSPEVIRRGWEEFEQQLRDLGEWDDNAKPSKHSALGIEENLERIAARASESQMMQFSMLIIQLEQAGYKHDDAVNIAYERCFT